MASTVVDVTIALVLISAAAITLVSVDRPTSTTDDRAEAVIEMLATSTATVEYGVARAETAPSDDPRLRRTHHDTLAGLMADAALATAVVDGDQPVGGDGDFARSVREETLRAIPPRTQVLVVWRPYPDAHIESRMAIGPEPPGDATVRAATATVPSGLSVERSEIESPTGDGKFDGIATALATEIVAGLFPPRTTRLALQGEVSEREFVAAQYRRTATAYETTLPPSLRDPKDDSHESSGARSRPNDVRAEDVEVANARLTEAVADNVESDLHRNVDDPADTAGAIHLDRVQITVRTWSA